MGVFLKNLTGVGGNHPDYHFTCGTTQTGANAVSYVCDDYFVAWAAGGTSATTAGEKEA
jgi:hypothetical protein